MKKSAIILAALLTARPTLAAEQCLEVNSIGLLLTIVGAGLVFRYGMSFQVRTGGWPQWVDDNPPDQDQIELERGYDRLSLLGFVYVVLGTFYQVAANWL